LKKNKGRFSWSAGLILYQNNREVLAAQFHSRELELKKYII
jgi:hypothetical protein